jgi:NRAMP (natural resistance-associated macrophage protein)-like metal ion transporter
MADEAFDTEHATAVLDEAHLGGIHGAFGKISEHDTGARRSWRARLLTLAAILGPGIIVMVADNDAGGVSTYSAAGQNYGYSLLWTLPLLIPVLIVNQEMVVRLGSVTGVGYAKLIAERFGRLWANFSVGNLAVLNFLIIVTEFIGVNLSLGYFGVSPYVSVPLAAVGLVAVTATGSFRRWERFMFVFVFANLLVIPLAILAHPSAGDMAHHLVVPGVQGGFDSTAVLFIIAIIGTTVAPWQLFFQQSTIVDKRITPRWINYERADTVIGSFIGVAAATLILATVAAAFAGTVLAGHYTNAGGVARGLATYVGHGAGAMYAIILLNASIIGAASVTLSTTYALGDLYGAGHSLDRSFGEARGFYAGFAGLVAIAGSIVLIPHAPLGLITTAVQALAGILLPSSTVFLLMLCNDRAVLGPWVNRPWLNVLAGLIVSVLFVMSLILMVTTVFTHVDVVTMLVVLGGVTLVGFVIAITAYLRGLARQPAAAPMPRERKITWRMPPVALLAPPRQTRVRTITLWAMWAYIAVAALILVVKALQLGGAI